MQFRETFERGETILDRVTLALSTPVSIEESLPEYQFLVHVDDTDPLYEETVDPSETATVDDERGLVDRVLGRGNRDN
jgi:hypothetical protein